MFNRSLHTGICIHVFVHFCHKTSRCKSSGNSVLNLHTTGPYHTNVFIAVSYTTCGTMGACLRFGDYYNLCLCHFYECSFHVSVYNSDSLANDDENKSQAKDFTELLEYNNDKDASD